MNETINDQLESFAKQFHDDHDRLRGQLIDSLASSAPPVARRVPKRVFSGVRICAGLSAAAIIVVCFLVFSSPRSLYGKVLKGLKSVSSAHVIGRSLHDGQWTTEVEIWYDRNCGVYEWRQSSTMPQPQIRIDDGSNQWHYVVGRNRAIQLPSSDPVGLMAKALQFSPERLNSLTPDPTGDCTIDGAPCRMFARTNPEKTYRMRLWIDQSNLPRRNERQQFKNGTWVTTRSLEMQYDIPIDPKRFRPDFGKDVQIVKTAGLFDSMFSLETALYHQEAIGMIVAVHQFKQIDDRRFLVVYSTRPSQQTVRRLGPLVSIVNGKHKNGSVTYGSFNLFLPSKRLPGYPMYFPNDLATYWRDGVEIHWTIIQPTKPWPKNMKTFPFSGQLITDATLRQERKDAGLPTHANYYPLTELALPKQRTPLDEALEQVYEETCLLEPHAFQLDLFLGTRPLTEKEQQQWIKDGHPETEVKNLYHCITSRPSGISLEQFKEKVRAKLKPIKRDEKH